MEGSRARRVMVACRGVEGLAIGLRGGEAAKGNGTVAGKKKRILWLHAQPEFYHNRMMDDLARGEGYRLPGMADEHADAFEWIAGFALQGPGDYQQNALPAEVPTMFLRIPPDETARVPAMRERYHLDWRADLRALGAGPLGVDGIIVSGYGLRTFREIIAEGARLGVPVTMWSDSNLRADRGHGLKMRLKRWLKRRLVRRIAESVDCLLTANSRGKAYWRYYGGDRAGGKVLVGAYYSDYRRIDEAACRSRAEVLARVGLAEADRYVYSSARLIPVKGLDLMIRAFRAGGWAARGWKYVIAGKGPLEAELRALAGDTLDRSILLVGFQQPSENLALMAKADLLAVPSRLEPHGIVVGEALAAGTPVLASNVVGAACGLVRDGVSGAVFRSEDAADLQRKLALLDDPAALAAMRPGARQAFEAWYRQTSPLVMVPRAVRRMLAAKGEGAG
jgi:glycosyltransferase involved in cell wall biosynthesis